MGFSRQDTGVGCHFLLQEVFPTQGLNPGLLHCRQVLYRLSHQGRALIYMKPGISYLGVQGKILWVDMDYLKRLHQ